jgi:HEAT repeat protein
MKKNRFLPALLAVLALASPAFAQGTPSELDGALKRMVSSTGDDYVAARASVVALGDSARAALESRLNGATWTDETFSDLAIATIAHAYLAHPDVVKRVNHLEGLDPSHYLLRRRPEPECGRELKRLGSDAAGPLLELYLKTFDRYPVTTAETPLPSRRETPEALAAKERIALRSALVMALAEAHHPSAFFVCRDVAKSSGEPEAVRFQAVEGLGTLATPASLAEIVALHDAATTPDSVRLAAIRGAARVPTSDALAFLEKRIQSDSTSERRQAVVALGTFGSSWGWQARGLDGTELRRRAAADLVELIRTGKPVENDVVIDALATIAHPASVALLEKASTDEKLSEAKRSLAKEALDRVKMAIARRTD